jgi:subfamily B ATP-binding cassette protein MsbA
MDQPKKKKLSWSRLSPLMGDALQLVWKARKRLLLAFPLILVNRLSSIILPGTTKYLVDDVIGRGQTDLLWKLAVIAAGASLLDAFSGFALAQLLGIAAQRSIADLRRKIQQHMQRLPVRYFDANKTGTLLSRVMYDAEGIRNLVGTGLVQMAAGLVTSAIALGILFYLSAKLTFSILGVLLFFGLVMYFAFRRLRPMFRKRNEIQSQVMGRLHETLAGIRVVKAYRAEKQEARIFTKGIHELLRNVMTTMRTTSAVGAISSLLLGIVSIIILLVGGNEVVQHRMTTGSLVSFTLYLAALVAPVVMIVSIGTQLAEAFAGLERMREVFGEKREDEDDPLKARIDELEGRIEFRDVDFAYVENVPVLKKVSFVAEPGTSTALVGPSGSGKSTLISLVSAFYRPGSGKIFVDGRDLNDLRLADYRGHLAIVAQDSFLFAGSIRENIALGNPGADEEEILRAARIAHVDEFAEKFPDGYGTVVGERGVKLSGGQKQRVSIARAIVADPRILILDEATSSLDSESEALIQDGLQQLMHGRTTFVIAHRLSTIRNADQILVLEEGEIIERGNHAQLIARSGRYRQLYERQYGVISNLYVNPGEEVADMNEEETVRDTVTGHS